MVFKFNNIGIVESAEIELKGLTVITGLNDTGKSFLSKSIYGAIKTINKANLQSNIYKSQKFRTEYGVVFSLYRQYSKGAIPQLINQPGSVQELANRINLSLQSNTNIDEINIWIDELKTKIINDISEAKILAIATFESVKGKIEDSFQKILTALKDESPDVKYKSYFDNFIIQNLFKGQFNSLYNSESDAEIVVSEGETEIFSLSVKHNITQSFKISSDILFSDVTLIESPIILQLQRYFANTLAYYVLPNRLNNQQDLPDHFVDISEKISRSYRQPTTTQFNEIYKQIKDIIQGDVYYNVEDQSIFYTKNDNQTIKSFNIASGIKSFGLLQILLGSDLFRTKSLLIIDEPEVHLHPKWEIEYAKIIVALSKIGIPIVISSHSPNLLRALPFYVNEYKTQNITKFYFGSKTAGNNNTNYEDVTNKMGKIFNALVEPMEKMFING